MAVIQQNFGATAIMLFLILFICTNNNFSKKANRLFLAAAVCVLVLIIEEAWEAQLALQAAPSMLRVLLSAIGYSLRPIIGALIVLIIYRPSHKMTALLGIPAIVNTFIAFSALFGPWAFSYSANNEFVRGPLGITPFITAAFYLILFVVLTVRMCGRTSNRTEIMTVVAIAVLCVIATVMESVYGYRAIQSAATGISIAYYYLFLHTNQNNRDPLTNALVRRRFYLDAEKYHAILTAVISIDVNDLKKINDTKGHGAGDITLITVTDVLKENMTRRCALYRMGGDEFMILCYRMPEQDVQEMVKTMKSELAKTDYRCAMGYAVYSHEAELDRVCQHADREMYRDKLEMKGQPVPPELLESIAADA